jgi:hypothetical protein
VTGTPPAPEEILSGVVGYVGPRRARAMRGLDRLLDLELRARRVPQTLDRLAAAVPQREVLALSVHRPKAKRIDAIVEELEASEHSVRVELGELGSELSGGKFENLNALLRKAGGADFDWLLVVDDDVVLPSRFVDRLIGVAERLELELLQPAQTLASHAAWPVTRRRPRALARETAFVEIGPVTAIRSHAAAELTPFPELRFGWGLDLHWAALARERRWRIGVVDALPVRHEEAGVASGYSHDEALAEARAFLATRPFVRAADAGRTLVTHRRLG